MWHFKLRAYSSSFCFFTIKHTSHIYKEEKRKKIPINCLHPKQDGTHGDKHGVIIKRSCVWHLIPHYACKDQSAATLWLGYKMEILQLV